MTVSDSEGVIVGAMVEAIDIVLWWSGPAVEDVMLVVLVWAPGCCGYWPFGVKPFGVGISAGARRFGMTRPLMV